MKFEIDEAIQVLARTPVVLTAMLSGLSNNWTASSGNTESWGPYDVIGHLIHGEKTDWMVRAEIILSVADDRTFVPFDRVAQFNTAPSDASFATLLDEFDGLRRENLRRLEGLRLAEADLARTGLHPELGEVTLEQLLTTWVVHDLGHIRQIAVSLAGKYSNNVGAWRKYLSILKA